ncbi:hypothetical protein FB381_4566 [Nocardioides albertanoniae]|uniref:Uncharacterized protein n=1 Tax=Nocardioides albertanoniae TaxID=1175486 RepID=A0A543ADG4_9ACTN|nr:hypothetical protein [Nocardioides albertanoniae]TQL70627.1 hypothetical protein FB381_4566 [Nocardioides albertanoniae]
MRSTTTRGVLWEVIAPLLRWPMRSPLRFFSVVAAIVFVIWGISQWSDAPDADPASQPERGSASASAGGSASAGASAAPVPDPGAAATKFVAAWARPDLTTDQWWAGINAAHPDESLAQALGTTDPATIDATKVVGSPQVLEQTDSEASVDVATDGPKVTVYLTLIDNVWYVANILPGSAG